jgi:hypothetical protein
MNRRTFFAHAGAALGGCAWASGCSTAPRRERTSTSEPARTSAGPAAPRKRHLVTHGLDDEGWGPIRANYLDGLLERLLAIETVEALPAGRFIPSLAPRGP